MKEYKVDSVMDIGDGFLVHIRLTPDSCWAETWTYEATAKYLDGLAKKGLLTVDELASMEGA